MQEGMVMPGVARIFLFFCCYAFLSPGVLAKVTKKTIGEVTQVDYITKTSQVTVYDKETFEAQLEAKEGRTKWLVLDDHDELAARFHITQKSFVKNRILLNGYFTNVRKSLYVGLKVAFEQPASREPILPDEAAQRRPLPRKIVNPKDQSTLILVPGGRFVYGSEIIGEVHYTSPAESEQDALQKVTGKKRVNFISILPFYIDAYEVTNRQFAGFLRETGTLPPPSWSRELKPEYPVDKVSYEQARRYCEWANKRLPTELEWEKAARGVNLKTFRNYEEELEFLESPRIYPTGQKFDPRVCITRESGFRAPLPVYSLEDNSAYKSRDGLHVKGLCGNVSEWTSSWFLPYRGNTVPNIMYGRRFKVIKGGSYDLDKSWAKAYSRRIGGIPDLASDHKAGFRCAMNAE